MDAEAVTDGVSRGGRGEDRYESGPLGLIVRVSPRGPGPVPGAGQQSWVS